MIHTLAYLWNSPWYNTLSSNIFVTIFFCCKYPVAKTQRNTWVLAHAMNGSYFFCWSWQEDFGVKEKDEDTEHCMVSKVNIIQIPVNCRHLLFSLYVVQWKDSSLEQCFPNYIIAWFTYSLEPMISAGNSRKPRFSALFLFVRIAIPWRIHGTIVYLPTWMADFLW